MKLKFGLFFILTIFVFFGCKTPYPLVNESKIETVIKERIITVMDTIKIPEATASGEALFYCDSLNRVRLSYIGILESDKLRLQMLYDEVRQSLKVKANTPADTIFIKIPVQISDTLIIKADTKYVYKVPDGYYKKKWYNILFEWFGIIPIAGLVLWIVVAFIVGKIKLPKK